MCKVINRLDKILECIENIDFIINSSNLKITQAMEDKIIKPAIRMNIIRIAEQFSKLKDDNEFKILENFTSEDLKGISAVRNYIAHDYDSTDDNIIEDVIRYNLPIFKNIIESIKKEKEYICLN
ncbi:HepT-like ribonuclease domain-containing protein [Aliarcobacter butzleri]|uniref:HepT-like ribonuclease domain-containing protein n=1 Tax=Aliarcobacter butzleri TaxID=28197 RepID=UPI00125F06A9|nr:HepT-like ribonuclease domain-containing protein [Aliarcobacter butzleri]